MVPLAPFGSLVRPLALPNCSRRSAAKSHSQIQKTHLHGNGALLISLFIFWHIVPVTIISVREVSFKRWPRPWSNETGDKTSEI